MSGFANSILGGAANLIRSAIRSPNYKTGVSGWTINKDGSAEFRDITLPAGSGGAIITIGAVAPSSPHTGDLWLDTAAGLELSQWDGSAWTAYQWGTSSIADGAVTSALLGTGAVATSNIQNAAITSALLATASVATANIQNGAVTSAQIAAAAGILGSQLSASAGITSGQVAFTARDIGGITTTVSSTAPASPKAGDLWFDSGNGYRLSQYSGGAWTAYQYGTSAIAAGSITAALIAANTITAAQIASGTITATQIAAATITGSLIAAGTVTSDLIASNAIVAGLIDAGAIDGMTLNAVVINGDTISAADILVSGTNGGVFVYGSGGTIVQTLTGSGSWVAPAGVTSVKVECWGAGGGGGGGTLSGGSTGAGGGEYAAEASYAITPGNSYPYSVGAAGTAGAGAASGSAGGNTTFDTTGVVAHGGGGGQYLGTSGTGGTGSTNTTHYDGGTGGTIGGGGGGGSGGTSSAGNSAGASTIGATAVSGGGPGGNGSTNSTGASPTTGPGGGGGSAGGANGNASGGAGYAGKLRLTYTSTSPNLIGSIAGAAGSADPVSGAAYPEGAKFDNMQAGTQITAPDGSAWTSTGIALASGKTITGTDSWHTPTTTSFSGTCRYRKTIDNCVEIWLDGTFSATGTVVVFTLPSGYIPALAIGWPVEETSGTFNNLRADVSTSGAVTVRGIPSTSAGIAFIQRIPLD